MLQLYKEMARNKWSMENEFKLRNFPMDFQWLPIDLDIIIIFSKTNQE